MERRDCCGFRGSMHVWSCWLKISRYAWSQTPQGALNRAKGAATGGSPATTAICSQKKIRLCEYINGNCDMTASFCKLKHKKEKISSGGDNSVYPNNVSEYLCLF